MLPQPGRFELELRVDQEGWPEATDYERLQTAFEELELPFHEGVDEPARRALSEMRTAATQARSAVFHEPGDLLIVDNHRALHGRKPFAPRYDGADRWLLRSFVTKDLRPSEAWRPSDGRIVEPEYGSSLL